MAVFNYNFRTRVKMVYWERPKVGEYLLITSLSLFTAAIPCRDGPEHVACSVSPTLPPMNRGPKRRPRDQAGRAVIGKFANARSVIHLSNLIQHDAETNSGAG